MASGIIGPISTSVNPIPYESVPAVNPAKEQEKPIVVENAGKSTEKSPGRRSSPAECETCKHRKYQDGSNENVSFKTAQTINPAAVSSKVRAHEQEHVNNAYTKAAQNNGKVISAVVSLHTGVCPECGRTYVSGGTTTTKIKYYGDSNQYHQNTDFANANTFNGQNVDCKG